MEIEYSNEIKGKHFSYRFANWEKLAIADSLKAEIKKRESKIKKIWNNPRNEGQVKYQMQVEILDREIDTLNEIIDIFSGKA